MSQDATKKAKDIIAEVSLKTFTFATQAKNDATQKAMTWTALLVEHFGDDLRTMYETAIHTLKVAITVLLFLSNSSIFVVGGITAFVIPQTMKEINQRLVDVWSGKKIPAVPVSRESSTESRNLLPTQPENSVEGSQGSLSPSESTTPELRTPGLSTRGKAVVVFATVFAWPIVFAAASFFVGAQVALNLQDDGIAI